MCMMPKEKWIVVYRFLFVFTCLCGIILGILDRSSDSFMGNGTALNFYTLQSNIWVLVLETYLLLKSIFSIRTDRNSFPNEKSKFGANLAKQDDSYWNVEVIKYILTVAIILTYLVYWLMLAPFLKAEYVWKPSNFLLHGTTPLMMLLDFLLLDREKNLPAHAIVLTVIPALVYFIFAFVRAEVSSVRLTLGSRYPYWFMDVDAFRLVWK